MGQREFLREFDDEIVGALEDAGLGDVGTYTPQSGGPSIACRVLIDRGVTLVGAEGQAINDAIVITAFADEIGAAPTSGARFRIGAETFTVDALSNKDESRYVCVVKSGY